MGPTKLPELDPQPKQSPKLNLLQQHQDQRRECSTELQQGDREPCRQGKEGLVFDTTTRQTEKTATPELAKIQDTSATDSRDNKNDILSGSDSQRSLKRNKKYYPPRAKFIYYTPLNTERDDILCTITHEPFFRKPPPLGKPKYPPDKSKRCEYHQDFGHTTQECNKLKEDLKRWIQWRHHKDYVSGYNQQGRGRDKMNQERSDNQSHQEVELTTFCELNLTWGTYGDTPLIRPKVTSLTGPKSTNEQWPLPLGTFLTLHVPPPLDIRHQLYLSVVGSLIILTLFQCRRLSHYPHCILASLTINQKCALTTISTFDSQQRLTTSMTPGYNVWLESAYKYLSRS